MVTFFTVQLRVVLSGAAQWLGGASSGCSDWLTAARGQPTTSEAQSRESKAEQTDVACLSTTTHNTRRDTLEAPVAANQ